MKPPPYSAPSPRSVCPHCASSSRPSNSSLSRKFTTPASASEPYTAEAPPVMISTLSIKEPGMMFRSTTPLPFAGISRLPSIRTRVDVLPRPRSWTLAWPPFDAMFEVLVYAGTNCGSVLSVVSTVIEPVRSKSSCVTETIGLADSKSRRAIRVPVTMISSSSSSRANAGACDSARHTSAAKPVAYGFNRRCVFRYTRSRADREYVATCESISTIAAEQVVIVVCGDSSKPHRAGRRCRPWPRSARVGRAGSRCPL